MEGKRSGLRCRPPVAWLGGGRGDQRGYCGTKTVVETVGKCGVEDRRPCRRPDIICQSLSEQTWTVRDHVLVNKAFKTLVR